MGTAPDPSHGAVSNHRRRRFDVRVVTHRRRSAFRLRDWRMRSKLAAVLIIPSVAFLVVATVQVAGLVGQTNVLSDFANQVIIGRPITGLVHDLQQERERVTGELASLRITSGGPERDAAIAVLKPLYERTDASVERLRQAAAPLADADASWRVAYADVLQAYDQVRYIRAAVPAAVLSTDTILANYHRAIDLLLNLLAEPSPGQDRPQLTDAVLRYVELARVKEISARIRGELYDASRTGRYGREAQARLSDLRAQQLTTLGAFRVVATEEQIRRYDQTSTDPGFVAATRLEEQTIPAATAAPVVLPAQQWWSASQRRQDLLRQVETTILDDAVAEAEAASGAQLRRTLLVAGGVLLVLLVAVLTSVIIGRSIARSLRMLRGQALRIAQIELPDALDRLRTVSGGVPEIDVAPAVVRSLDELGELAEAFVAVHRSAVSVAVEQAVMRRNVNAMFVNLARRSQVLVERQLELLDELEREESDPDQLENLFRLDHLAARMRRNDESLLVLAGSESTRRWNRPVMLSAVLLAASAEIEQYQRIRQEIADPLHVVGHVIGDLVHLLAELLENATAFSRPDTLVRVIGRADPDGAVLEIVDAGLGMSETALAEANETLAQPPAADVAASERMGLFVVSHLAARHGIRVGLQVGEEGLVAVVRLPADLVAPAPVDQVEPPTAPRRMAVSPPTGRVRLPLAGAPVPQGLPAGQHNGDGARNGVGAPPVVVAPPVPQPGVPGPVPDPRPGGVDETRVLELPVAGRPPGRSATPRRTRPVPTRAEDVLSPPTGAPAARSTWWSRPGPSDGAAPAATGVGAPAPPVVPVTGGTNHRGLPIRVPMAQLPAVTESATPSVPLARHDPDPEAVGGMLSRLYGGVRRAEAEETTEISMPPAGGRSEGMQQ
ncbi:ATP-binding protein [Micromonospora echinofusca]|uniref:histidine kinase n=1 Tax=Micromonospora echinofusca TaxID=47858 RepID=A0ABS3VUS8_MICEH|nr:ATP-binding protein [Micromonospora echinofusca]MBO4208296.1 ATP-binding protein [Micromonospora echinofusca]